MSEPEKSWAEMKAAATKITEGQFKGWMRAENGDIFKSYKDGEFIWYYKGMFDAFDKEGVFKGTFLQLAEAEKVLNIT